MTGSVSQQVKLTESQVTGIRSSLRGVTPELVFLVMTSASDPPSRLLIGGSRREDMVGYFLSFFFFLFFIVCSFFLGAIDVLLVMPSGIDEMLPGLNDVTG